MFNRSNGYKIKCPSKSEKCTIKDITNTTEFYAGLASETLSEHTEHLNFENSQLNFLKHEIFIAFPDLRSLNASALQLESINDEDFKSAYKLEKLDLSNNNLTSINTTMLSPLQKLKILNVSQNGIDEFDFKTLKENNKNLKELNVSYNKLTNVTISEKFVKFDASHNLLEHLEVHMKSKLEYLDLSGNRLTSGVKKSFIYLKSIEYLDISDMMLEPLEIDLFVDMEKLQSLMLRNTGITKIDYGTFSNLKDLLTLDLSYNQITDLDLNMLLPLNKLSSLDISGNKIVTLNIIQDTNSVLSSLKQIGIEQNNWDCVFLTNFYTILNGNDIKVMTLKDLKKNSTNVNFIGCNHEITTTSTTTLATSTTTTTPATTSATTTTTSTSPEDQSTIDYSKIITTTSISEIKELQRAIELAIHPDESSFYKVLAGIAITLLVVAILLKLKKYLKFNYFQSYRFAKESEQKLNSPLEMEQKGIEVY
ncbi:unnamed protein product [Diamesa serratosioi]